MKLAAKTKEGKTVVVCGRCGALSYPTTAKKTASYLKKACYTCEHSQTRYRTEALKKGRSTANSIAKRLGVDLSAGG
jgi:hypothetical protein